MNFIERTRSGLSFRNVKALRWKGFAKSQVSDFTVRLANGRNIFQNIRPEQISVAAAILLGLFSVGSAVFWMMRAVQVSLPEPVSSRGVVFYTADTGNRLRTLFGEKGFDASRMVLRGVVITGRENGVQQGMALIEIDGNPADAVSIGEMVPPGIRLEKIEPGSAVVSYQGREINLQQ